MQILKNFLPFVQFSNPVVIDQVVVDGGLGIAILSISIIKALGEYVVVVAVDCIRVADDDVFRSEQAIVFSQDDVIVGLKLLAHFPQLSYHKIRPPFYFVGVFLFGSVCVIELSRPSVEGDLCFPEGLLVDWQFGVEDEGGEAGLGQEGDHDQGHDH